MYNYEASISSLLIYTGAGHWRERIKKKKTLVWDAGLTKDNIIKHLELTVLAG